MRWPISVFAVDDFVHVASVIVKRDLELRVEAQQAVHHRKSLRVAFTIDELTKTADHT